MSHSSQASAFQPPHASRDHCLGTLFTVFIAPGLLSRGEAAPARREGAILSQSTATLIKIPELSFPSSASGLSHHHHPSWEQQERALGFASQPLLFSLCSALFTGCRILHKSSDLSQPQFLIHKMGIAPAQMTSQSLWEEPMR